MAGAADNFPEVGAAIGGIAHAFDLTRPYGRSTLGATALDLAADRIQQRSLGDQAGPGGVPWTDLARSTLDRKERLGLSPLIGVEHGDMLSQEQVRGEREIAADGATMTYGLDDEQRQKAEWFQKGTPTQPPRPFYELDDRDEADLDALFDDALDAAIVDQGGA